MFFFEHQKNIAKGSDHGIHHPSLSFYAQYGKRLLDLTLVITALILLAPLYVLIALLIRLKLGAPVLFRQQRAGLHGTPFEMFKFRTMTNARDRYGQLLPDAERLTPLGRFLRSTSLDELPELINVLKGHMSLVGPRPLLVRYLGRYSPEQMRRHEVRPGLTGWAQVRGRNALSWEDRFALDVEYVDHISLWKDLQIVTLTVWVILARKGINQSEGITMEEFWGSAGADEILYLSNCNPARIDSTVGDSYNTAQR